MISLTPGHLNPVKTTSDRKMSHSNHTEGPSVKASVNPNSYFRAPIPWATILTNQFTLFLGCGLYTGAAYLRDFRVLE